MKQLVIRECAFRACEKAHNGKQILFEIIREAFTGEKKDWDRDDLNEDFGFYTGPDVSALHEAIAPDVFASVREDGAGIHISNCGVSLMYDESKSRWND